MYYCKSQAFILEHFLRVDTSRPESWLSAFQKITDCPHLSRKLLSLPEGQSLRDRLSFVQSENLKVLGSYLRSPSTISGINAGCATIIMPIAGTVGFEVAGDHFLCGPWVPLLLEPNENFHATLSEETHLFIVQLPRLTDSGYRPSFQRHPTALVEIITTFLYETPFFSDYEHAQNRLDDFSAQLYEFTKADYAPPAGFAGRKQISHDRRLCNAIQILNDELHTYIDIQSVASRAGLSLRSLHYIMKQVTGQSPYQYLRARRLTKARESIIRSYPENTGIARLALNWRFQNPGRFSGYYKKHFGEHPNQTLDELDRLQSLARGVKAVWDESGNTGQQWLTCSHRD